MTTLRALGDSFGTDKGTHGYLERYEELFAPRRDREETVLEIGVKDGASLRLWEAWFPRAPIVGVDNDPRCRSFEKGRVSVFTGDQGDRNFMASVGTRCRPLGVVIDDGSHMGPDQIASFEALWPILETGGLYIIEDLEACFHARYGPSAAPFIHGFFECVNGRGPYWSVRRCELQRGLCILEKGDIIGRLPS